ncbi:MAG TPA: hypothetical protein ENN56_01980 [Firmicutes bacterium]|nr:hypothetical protein [Bacillota bacterium]
MARTLIALVILAVLAVGCQIGQPDPDYYLARATTPEGKHWQVYFRGAWRDISVDGMSEPTTLREHVFRGDNWFMFAGVIDTVELRASGPHLPVFMLEAWSIIWPVRRRLTIDGPLDTTGFQHPVEDDFIDKPAFQRYGINYAAQWWPLVVNIDYPEGEARARGISLRRSLFDLESE